MQDVIAAQGAPGLGAALAWAAALARAASEMADAGEARKELDGAGSSCWG